MEELTIPLVWTKEKPTNPGWYWAIEEDGSKIVVCYHNSDKGIGFEDDEHCYGGGWITPDLHAVEWAGPIPKPKDSD